MTEEELSRRLRELNHMAGLILAMLDREVAQYANVEVTIEEWATTASTDGIRIVLPFHFHGANVFEYEALATGLLVHEAGHFLQRLDEISILIEQGCPHWLANIALDIQGESLIACLSAKLGATLVVPRALCASVAEDNRKQYDTDAPFVEQAVCAIMAARFANRNLPFDPSQVVASVTERVATLLDEMDQFKETAASDISKRLHQLLRTYPELAQPPETEPPSWPGATSPNSAAQQHNSANRLDKLLATTQQVVRAPKVTGKGLQALRGLDSLSTLKPNTVSRSKVRQVSWVAGPISDAVQSLARQLALRFETPSGGISVLGADEFQIHDALRGLFPFAATVAHPGGQSPRSNVVLCVDTSPSMNEDGKREKAKAAAQALCLALQQSGSDVRAAVFDNDLYHWADYAPDILFAAAWPPGGGTSFEWLTELWQRFPKHRFVLLTDGEGDMPVWIQATDHQRSAGVVIPKGDAKLLSKVCAETVTLDTLELLPAVMSTLVPLTGLGT